MKKIFEFLYLGNLQREKGAEVLLESCGLLKSRGLDFRCHFVGASSKDISVEDLGRLVDEGGLSSYVVVHGPLYGEKKEAMLRSVGALVFPTFYSNECFPFVVLEAMKSGLPVISTEEGAIPDMVLHEQTGLLVERRNVVALADAMSYLIENPEKAAVMGQQGQAYYAEKFTRERYTECIRAILRNT